MKYLLLLLLLLTACSNTNFVEAKVTRVIDGDTFIIDSGEKVRLICINTPEHNMPFFDESTSFTKSLILNKTVILERDTKNKDKYGRLLRYVYVNNESLNALLLKNNLAIFYPVSPNLKHCSEYESLVSPSYS